jgi:hypothetical protein
LFDPSEGLGFWTFPFDTASWFVSPKLQDLSKNPLGKVLYMFVKKNTAFFGWQSS